MDKEEAKMIFHKELEKARHSKITTVTLSKEEWKAIQQEANPGPFRRLKLRWRKWQEWRKWCNCGKIRQWLIFLGFIYDEHFDFFVMPWGKE